MGITNPLTAEKLKEVVEVLPGRLPACKVAEQCDFDDESFAAKMRLQNPAILVPSEREDHHLDIAFC